MPEPSAHHHCPAGLNSLDLYLREIGRYGQLSADEEVELGRRMEAGRAARDELETAEPVSPARRAELVAVIEDGQAATNRFIVSNLRLVVSLAKQHRHRDQALADAIADGNVGLLKAVERYDWRLGFKFSTFATWWIRQAITRGGVRSRRALTMSPSTDLQVRRVYRSRGQLEEVLGRPPTSDEVARATGLSRTLVVRYLTLGTPAVSVDALDVAANGREPLDELAPSVAAEEVRRLLSRLDARERRILELRFGLGNTAPHSYAEVANLLGTTPGRVRQIEHRVFSRLRRTSLGQGAHELLAS
jgi:RNA polymerase sigma factor (sigma-70 family)